MRIAYITAYDPLDINNWSGLGFFIWKSLAARGIEVELIGPLPLPLHLRKLTILKRRFHHLFGKFYWPDGDWANVRARSLLAGKRLRKIRPVDAVMSATVLPVAGLAGDVPLVVYADATLRALFKTYPAHANMAGGNYRDADKIERHAQRRAAALVYSSEWAAESARNDYSVPPAKVHVVPFGANLEIPPSRASVEQAIAVRDRHAVRLLFMGVEWERKGGPAAVAVARRLNAMGIPAQLTVIGCEPQLDPADQTFITLLGYVKKSGTGLTRIQAELSRSHFLLMPSKAECFGIVYCEASAFGVPSIALNVGGVASAVRNGRNGRRFEPGDSPAQIAEWIATTFRNFENYRQLALSSLSEFEEHLNWNVAGEKLEHILQSVIAKK